MKRPLFSFLAAVAAALLFTTTAHALPGGRPSPAADTVVKGEPRVHSGPSDYFASLDSLPAAQIIERVDAFIEATPEAQRAGAAGLAFDYYSSSPVLGHDAVAVHLADRWFLSRILEWPDPATYPLLYAYAEFNRSSLIGMSAPGLVMEGMDGRRYDIREFVNRNKVLYFYDDQCKTCLEQSRELARFAREYQGATLYIYAVNTGSDPGAWLRYVRENFDGIKENPAVKLVHLHDPQDRNDYRRKYGLLSTPGMFLINAQNIIEGRRLDCDALARLLEVQYSGKRVLGKLIADIFEAVAPQDPESIRIIAESLRSRVGEDRALYRETFYTLYNYLRNEMSHTCQEGAVAVAQDYILNRDDIWSPEFREEISEALARYRLNPLGSKATDLLLQDRDGKNRKMLGGCSRRTLLFFHIVGCGDCRREHALLRENSALLRKKGVRVIYIYLGHSEEEWQRYVEANRDLEKEGWVFLHDVRGTSGVREKYDVQYVPRIYLLDRSKTIIAKDIDVPVLVNLLQE